MANVKITALNNLASADVDDGDVFVIDDISCLLYTSDAADEP